MRLSDRFNDGTEAIFFEVYENPGYEIGLCDFARRKAVHNSVKGDFESGACFFIEGDFRIKGFHIFLQNSSPPETHKSSGRRGYYALTSRFLGTNGTLSSAL
jgi:hypothetical protein